jgi:hypothetical protein
MEFKNFIIAIGIISIVIFCLGLAFSSDEVKKTEDIEYKISGPYTYQNLTIFLLHGEDKIKGKIFLTLKEAMESKKVIIYETGEVNELSIENVSENEEVYIQAGDIVKGGRQDRAIAVDLILPAKSGKIPVSSFCVEHGRWSKRGQESSEYFNESNEQLASKDLKLAVRYGGNQNEVWDKVSEVQDKLTENLGDSVQSEVSRSSLQLTLESQKVQSAIDEYVKKLSSIIDGKTDVIGYAFAINGNINSADVYVSNALFNKLWTRLLKASAVEAVAEFQKDMKFKDITVDTIKTFIVNAERGQSSQKDITGRTKMLMKETEKNVLFETQDVNNEGIWIRRNYMTK